ncbi:MAG: FliI/YscN family ATPase [Spirochaetaceae bacterium]|jgi:flagellum-specific ATP synthase|nr:FliI/YscN family ATPase [Spirochaetaceae bacterium]
MPLSILSKYIDCVENTDTIHCTGRVTAVRGMLIESQGPRSMVGELCTVTLEDGGELFAEVVGLEGPRVKLMPYGDTRGIGVGCEVRASGSVLQVGVGQSLLGRVIDALGRPCDGKKEIIPEDYYPAIAPPPPAMERAEIRERIDTGVRAIDSMLTLARGQRIGIFSGSGVGKSTLLSMIARNTNADVNVIALEGERVREVLDFINRDLGEEGMKRSVVVVSTSDQPSIARLRSAFVATAVAEYFRDQGKDVMLMFDSITRFAHAQREIGLAAGEPPAQRGYPPSVFEMIPKLLERAGAVPGGSITGIYTVLVDSDDLDEPISDKVRGTIDGHIVLARRLAQRRHYPAIDVLGSISRLANRVSGKVKKQAVTKILRLMASYAENEDMILVGAYQKGASAEIDEAIAIHGSIEAFLTQDEYEVCPFADTVKKLGDLAGMEIPETELAPNPSAAAAAEGGIKAEGVSGAPAAALREGAP